MLMMYDALVATSAGAAVELVLVLNQKGGYLIDMSILRSG